MSLARCIAVGKKGLEYDPIFKVPPALQDKHEISMREITGSPKHASDVLTKVTARGASNYETSKEELEELLRRYSPILEKDPRRKRWEIMAGGAFIGGGTQAPKRQRGGTY